MSEKLSELQPFGRMDWPEIFAYLTLYLCFNKLAFITGCDYSIDSGPITLNSLVAIYSQYCYHYWVLGFALKLFNRLFRIYLHDVL
jgi:hypothetical protein